MNKAYKMLFIFIRSNEMQPEDENVSAMVQSVGVRVALFTMHPKQ